MSYQVRVTEMEMKLEDEKRRTAEANSHARRNEISSNDMKASRWMDKQNRQVAWIIKQILFAGNN